MYPEWIANETVLVTCVSIDADAVRSLYLIESEDGASVVAEFNGGSRTLLNGVDVEMTDEQLSDLCGICDATAANSIGMPEVGRRVSVPPNF